MPLESVAAACTRKAQLWFGKSEFAGIEQEKDEDEEIRQAMKSYERKRGRMLCTEESSSLRKTALKDSSSTGDHISSDSDSDAEETEQRSLAKAVKQRTEPPSDESDSDSSDEDLDNEGTAGCTQTAMSRLEEDTASTKPKARRLDPEGLALGALMVQSRKKHEDLIDSAFNRCSNNDEGLPDWFVEEENKFCQKQLPVTKEMVREYRARLREINARPIKKVAEAKARKKHRALKKLEKARKKAELVTDAVDVSSHEKMQQIRAIYKKAGLLGKKKKEVQYVVAKKSGGRRARPLGVKGPYRMVDPRMKKDRSASARKKDKGQKKSRRMKKRQ